MNQHRASGAHEEKRNSPSEKRSSPSESRGSSEIARDRLFRQPKRLGHEGHDAHHVTLHMCRAPPLPAQQLSEGKAV
eukprot:5769005-Pleurochrysis_carterae.AAC.2